VNPVKRRGKQAERARQTRQRILDAARTLFVSQGYGATTLQEIADQAGVSVQTIYFSFGNKGSVLKELVDVTIAGDDEPIATLDRPWFRESVELPTAAEQLKAHVHGTRRVLDRVSAITEVVRTAVLTDPGLAERWQYDTDPRHTVQTVAAKALASKPDIDPHLSVEQIADRLFGLLSPDLYLLMIRDRRWAPDEWEHWIYDTLRSQLCR
jgi:AcrR family transcriptional regulator